MTKQVLIALVVLACSAPSEAPAQAEPPPPHGAALTADQYLVLYQAAVQALASHDETGSNSCNRSNINPQPEVCARSIAAFADALALEVRRSENWPR